MTTEENNAVKRKFETESGTKTEADLDDIVQQEGRVQKLIKKVVSRFKDLPLLWSLLKDYKSGLYKDVPWKLISALVFAFAYLVCPIDLIPDIIPLLGLTDDIAVFGLVVEAFGADIDKYKRWKYSNTKQITQ